MIPSTHCKLDSVAFFDQHGFGYYAFRAESSIIVSPQVILNFVVFLGTCSEIYRDAAGTEHHASKLISRGSEADKAGASEDKGDAFLGR